MDACLFMYSFIYEHIRALALLVNTYYARFEGWYWQKQPISIRHI